MEREVRYCTTDDGVRIAYVVIGEGPSLVFATDGAVSHVDLEWSQHVNGLLLGELSRRNRLIRFDTRGSGLSDRVQPLTIDEQVLDLEAVVRRLELHEFALSAMQSAAMTAIMFAARHPGMVSRLVLVDGWIRNKDVMGRPQVQAMMAAAASDFEMATEMIGAAAFGAGREESRTHGAYIRACVGQDYFVDDRGVSWDVSDEASQLTVPTLVLHHRHLQYVTEDMTRDLAARIQDSRFAAIEGLWADDPAGLGARVAEFVNNAEHGAYTGDHTEPGPFRTILFTDLVGHTEMMSRLGDERGRAVLREHEAITREVLKQHAGTEVKTMGDGFMASFGSVTKAVECAVALQRAFAERNTNLPSPAHGRGTSAEGGLGEGEPLNVRVGLNAGEPIEEHGDLFGATVILASRIAARAEGGEILVSDTVRGLCSGKGFLFGDRGEFTAKGFEDPIHIYEVNWRT
jgi:class 3 adenylate cyclase